MFDAKNERTIGKEKDQTSRTANHDGSLVTSADIGMGFEDNVSGSANGFLTSLFGQPMADGIEKYMNESGVSMHDICQNTDTVSEQLRALFGTAADIFIDSMLKETFASRGLENQESYTRFDLVYGLKRLKKLSNATSKQTGGAA